MFGEKKVNAMSMEATILVSLSHEHPSHWPCRIYSILYGLAWITIFCHLWGDYRYLFLSLASWFGNDFNEWRSHGWKSMPCRLTSDKRLLFTLTHTLCYFLHAILCPEHTNPLKKIIDRSFRHCPQGRSFRHFDVTTVNLWCHANAMKWHCDVIFVNCSCTRKLAQCWFSLKGLWPVGVVVTMLEGAYETGGPIRGIARTVKPVYNDHLMGYFSAFWSSSWWPRAT